MSRLHGKTAIIFGAGPNIGGTVAHFLAREGARVAVCDMDPAAAQKAAAFLAMRGYEAIALSVNAFEEAEVKLAVEQTVARFGGLDIAFNMAGKVHWSPIVDMDVGRWREAVLSFPTAGMLTTKHAARAMIATGASGSIIHLLSTAAHFGQPAGAAYCAAKAALLNFARAAAMELAPQAIRVNTITPCAMEHQLWTKMRKEVVERKFELKPDRPHYSRDDFLKNIPLGRFPRASDIGDAAVFLASDASSFLTGVDIPVDGGLRHKYPAWRPGDQSGITVADYVQTLRRTEFGEELEPIIGASEVGG